MRTTLGFTLVLTALTVHSVAQAEDGGGKQRRVAAVDASTLPPAARSTDTVVLTPVTPQEIPAPRGAFELGVEGGYTQPFGEIGDGRSFRNIAEAGGAVGLSVGYRITPHWGVALTSQFHDNKGDDDLGRKTDVRGLSMGAKATFHIRPYKLVDPYLSLGTGYRALWMAPEGAPNELVHGFQLARALIGVDFRVTRDVSIGPVIGADFNMFLWDNPQGSAVGDQKVSSARPSTFLFGGLGATFEIGGQRVLRHPIFEQTIEPGAPSPNPPERPLATTGITVDQSIRTACKIDDTHAFFAFDSADVKANDSSTLRAVATCFSTGPLKGHSLLIIGHADPRGSDRYNLKLGQSRANAVAQFLSGEGLKSSRVDTASDGDRDAKGVDENGWTYDRRVDLRLEK